MGAFRHFENSSLEDLFNFNFSNFVCNHTIVSGCSNQNQQLSPEQIRNIFREQYMMTSMSGFDTVTMTCLIVAFVSLILFGATGNGLVVYVVAKNPNMRTPRNIFIVNLAISDLTLCLFTQPSNLMKVCMSQWTLGEFMCKFVPMFAGTNVFVSTISITAIALDRFQVIVYPTKESMKHVGAAVSLIAIWGISLLMASPLVIFNITNSVAIADVHLYSVCVENPALHYERGAYSIASMIFQYIVPILIVTVAHARICNKLKYRMVTHAQSSSAVQSQFQRRKNEREAKRKRKTNMLLVMIAVVFSCAWMPLNVFNIMADFNGPLLKKIDQKGLVSPMCHLCVLISACANPVLYGWLNDNFRREFVKVMCLPCCMNFRVICKCAQRPSDGTSGAQSSMVIYTKAHNGASTLGVTREDLLDEPTSEIPPHVIETEQQEVELCKMDGIVITDDGMQHAKV